MRYLFLFTLIIFTHCGYSQKISFKTLEENIKGFYHQDNDAYSPVSQVIKNLNIDPKAVDMVTIEVYQKRLPDEHVVKNYLKLFRAEGTWSDINYADTKESGWEPKIHTERILLLTTLYTDPKSIYFKNTQVKEIIHKALNYWFVAKLVCKNWWYNEIGVPKTLGAVFILLKPELSVEEKANAVVVLNHSSIRMTGQNKVWLSGNVLFKAILLEDEHLAQIARDSIFSELRISAKEGIQSDFSFHQHGPQQQFGNYGLSFINTLSFWSRVLSKTSLEIDRNGLEILRGLMINGYNWITWKGFFDVNSFGRQFFKGVEKSKALAVAYSMIDMTFIDPDNKASYLAFISRNYSDNHLPLLTGTKHFWRSDMTIHRSKNWFSSIKMSSDRIQATEALNRENMQGYYLGSGSTFISVIGNEFEGIFPYLDWEKLPGVTHYQTGKPLAILSSKGYRNKGDFTGGVTNGINGVTAFKLNRDSLYANKAWFYLDDKLICLGSNIHSNSDKPVLTTINQTKLNGSVYTDNGQKIDLKKPVYNSTSTKWVYHNQIGYYGLQSSAITLNAKNQTGNWSKIAYVYNQDSDITEPVFTLEIIHDLTDKKNGSYAYTILPGITLDQMKTFKPDFDIIKNDLDAQIVAKKDKSLSMFAIYNSTPVQISGLPIIYFNTPGLYIIERKVKEWVISISDPTQKLTNCTFTLNGKRYTQYLPQALEKGKTTEIRIQF